MNVAALRLHRLDELQQLLQGIARQRARDLNFEVVEAAQRPGGYLRGRRGGQRIGDAGAGHWCPLGGAHAVRSRRWRSRSRDHNLVEGQRRPAPDVKAEIIARGTPGFSGADLANLVNEAALFAARKNKRLVDMDDFERAKDKIVMGAERRSMVMPEEERRNTAFHESGHAVVAKLLPKTDPVHKVTIIPRGRALGVTMQLPEQDRYSMDRDRLLSTIAVLFGGRIAEELFMGQMTTGASNDFERATALARSMVTQWGMSDAMGPMVYGENEGEVFLGRSITTHKNVSEVTMQKVDSEIRKIIDQQFALAKKLILDNRDKVEAMAKALLEMETIDADQIQDIMDGRPPRPPRPPAQAPQQPPQAGAPGAAEPAPVS